MFAIEFNFEKIFVIKCLKRIAYTAETNRRETF